MVDTVLDNFHVEGGSA
jgi:hypothetical protein